MKAFPENQFGQPEVSQADLGSLTYAELVPYCTYSVGGLPELFDDRWLNITFIRRDESDAVRVDAWLNFCAQRSADDTDDKRAANLIARRRRHLTRFFLPLARQLGFEAEREVVPWIARPTYLTADIFFSRDFDSRELSTLSGAVEAFSRHFRELLLARESLLFLCHATEDKSFVDELAAFLDSQEVPIWCDRREIRVGESIVERVQDGLRDASHLVLVLSESSVEKPWVKRELASSLMRQLGGATLSLLPIRIDFCHCPELLADLKFADCRKTRLVGFSQILEALK